MSKVLLVTMGTSLFHSATWEPTTELPTRIPYYEREWIQNQERLVSPEKRLESSCLSAIRDSLIASLSTENGPEWARCLPEDLKRGSPVPGRFLMRYSAELATVIKLSGNEDVREFLRSYARIYVLVDDNVDRSSAQQTHVAGCHLVCYLKEVGGAVCRAEIKKIPGLSSVMPDELIGSDRRKGALTVLGDWLQDVVDELNPPMVDIVISGGYKMYGIALAHLSDQENPQVRLIYMHETSEDLIIYSQFWFEMMGQRRRNPIRRIRSRGVL